MQINHQVTREIDCMTAIKPLKELIKSVHDQLQSYQMLPSLEQTLQIHNKDSKRTISSLGKPSQLSALMIEI